MAKSTSTRFPSSRASNACRNSRLQTASAAIPPSDRLARVSVLQGLVNGFYAAILEVGASALHSLREPGTGFEQTPDVSGLGTAGRGILRDVARRRSGLGRLHVAYPSHLATLTSHRKLSVTGRLQRVVRRRLR